MSRGTPDGPGPHGEVWWRFSGGAAPFDGRAKKHFDRVGLAGPPYLSGIVSQQFANILLSR